MRLPLSRSRSPLGESHCFYNVGYIKRHDRNFHDWANPPFIRFGNVTPGTPCRGLAYGSRCRAGRHETNIMLECPISAPPPDGFGRTPFIFGIALNFVSPPPGPPLILIVACTGAVTCLGPKQGRWCLSTKFETPRSGHFPAPWAHSSMHKLGCALVATSIISHDQTVHRTMGEFKRSLPRTVLP